MIEKLKLTNFRQFDNIELEFNNDIIIITGDNTRGKSTILESIFLITNGTSPWGEFEDEYYSNQEDSTKYLRVEIKDQQSDLYTYFRDTNKRQLKINNSNTIPRKFFENISSVMFSPEQIDLLMISSSKRREFLDNLLSKIDIEYGDTLNKFHKSLKHRNAYLKKLAKKFFDNDILETNDTQLKYWSNEVARYSAEIMSKRAELIKELKGDDFEVIYKPNITLNLFEDLAQLDTLKRINEEAILNSVKKDIVTGVTNCGAHRDDWIIYRGKEVRRFGSRGEKRVAVGKLIFLTLEIISNKLGKRPILLLDDIPSELDSNNTKAVMTNEIIGKQQTFITTIDISHIPTVLKDRAQIIDLNNLQ